MPYLGFMRNGRLSYLHIGNAEATRENTQINRDNRAYWQQARILDEETETYWRIENGYWRQYPISKEDETVEAMIAELGINFSRNTPPRSEPVETQEPVEAQERVIDLRTYTRTGRARRQGRRKRREAMA